MRAPGGGGEGTRAERSRIDRMNYLVGDVQGCCDALDRLLAKIGFSPSRDRICRARRPGQPRPAFAGDAAPAARPRRRGAPACSATTTCTCSRWRTACARRTAATRSTTSSTRPTARRWLDWLRQRPLALRSAHGWLMVHAGVVPQWDARADAALAGEVERAAARRRPARLPAGDVRQRAVALGRRRWPAPSALRFIVNVLTRIRFVAAPTARSTSSQGRRRRRAARLFAVVRRAGPRAPPARRSPSATGRRSAWSTAPDLLALDTGCVWGGAADRGAHRRRAARGRSGDCVRAGAAAAQIDRR